ncbi:MAG: GNAT family N-acetyltransferase [Spirochaetaceae bacterium]|jgi:GNAT superfamily N-acetyltransferase|nr:GNAT family N-acetyltransferase [Spirochaetaceae bacterium]
MAVLVRPVAQPDIPYVYGICLKTGDAGKDASPLFYEPFLLGQYYAAPYLFFDPSLCFIAEEDYIPRGYIAAAADSAAFYQWLDTAWLPPLRRRYPEPFPQDRIKSAYEERILKQLHQSPRVSEAQSPWLSRYPAHLHIDLLPEIQGKGWGKVLMKTLFAELEQRKIPGVHLGVAAANTAATAFYKKLGFSVLQNETWGFTLGKELSYGF